VKPTELGAIQKAVPKDMAAWMLKRVLDRDLLRPMVHCDKAVDIDTLDPMIILHVHVPFEQCLDLGLDGLPKVC